jgi:probable phosphoglycerate mutase
MSGIGELLLIRHGETAWSRTGQLAGRADLPLTDAGVAAGRALRPLLERRHVVAAFSSPLSRAVRTAELAGLADVKPDPDLLEWDYGDFEGLTGEQIGQARPGWDLWLDLDPAAGRMLSHPQTGTLSSLAYEHEQPVVSAWNVLP